MNNYVHISTIIHMAEILTNYRRTKLTAIIHCQIMIFTRCQWIPQLFLPFIHRKKKMAHYTQRNLFKILLNQTELRLHLPFSDWFGSKRTSVWFQISLKMVTTIWFQFDLTRFWKDSSVCSRRHRQITDFSTITATVNNRSDDKSDWNQIGNLVNHGAIRWFQINKHSFSYQEIQPLLIKFRKCAVRP